MDQAMPEGASVFAAFPRSDTNALPPRNVSRPMVVGASFLLLQKFDPYPISESQSIPTPYTSRVSSTMGYSKFRGLSSHVPLKSLELQLFDGFYGSNPQALQLWYILGYPVTWDEQ